jgi:predicted nucleic acid-binding protein
MTTSGSAEVLVDTSAWIDYFRQREPFHGIVAELLDADRICCVGLILAELLQGAKGEQEQTVLRGFPDVFPFIEEALPLWIKAGELSATLRRQGQTVGLSDCFIAVAARERGAAVLTNDRHFDWLSQAVGVALIAPANN